MVKELYMDECNELKTMYERDVMNWDFVEEKKYITKFMKTTNGLYAVSKDIWSIKMKTVWYKI